VLPLLQRRASIEKMESLEEPLLAAGGRATEAQGGRGIVRWTYG